jgi:hypothetical protein
MAAFALKMKITKRTKLYALFIYKILLETVRPSHHSLNYLNFMKL